MRTKTVNVKTNYKHSYINNMLCRLCEKPDEDECEEHLLVCNELITDHKLRIDISKIRYNDIYGTFSQQKSHQIMEKSMEYVDTEIRMFVSSRDTRSTLSLT